MQRIAIPYFDNTIKDISGRLIGDTIVQNSRNIILYNKKVRNRYGISQLSESIGSPILKSIVYKQLYNDAQYVVAFTATDAYYLDSTGKWKYITRCFNKGTVTRTGTTVELDNPAPITNRTIAVLNDSATEWFILVDSFTGIEVGMCVTDTYSGHTEYIAANTYVSHMVADADGNKVYLTKRTVTAPAVSDTLSFAWQFRFDKWTKTNYKIAFGTSDPNDPDAVWVDVASITDADTLTVETSGSNSAGTSYVLRLCYSGDIDDRWEVCFPYDDSMDGGGDKCLVATNGIDFVQVWRGEQDGAVTYCDDLLTYPNLCKHISFYGTVSSEHMIASNIYDKGTGVWNSTAIEVSDAGEMMWDDGATYPLFDSSDVILGSIPLMTRIVIYKRDSISIADPSYSDDVTNPFTIQQNVIRDLGPCSIGTVCDIGTYHIFFDGKNIVKFDGFNHAVVDVGISLYVNKIINMEYLNRCFAFTISELSLYCLVIPTTNEYCDTMIIYNYDENNFTFWDFNTVLTGYNLLPISTVGEYINSSNTTWNSLIVDLVGALSSGVCSLATGYDVDDLSVGMRVIPSGYAGSEHLYIMSINTGADTFEVGTLNTGVPDSNLVPANMTLASSVNVTECAIECGFTAAQSIQRWSDLITVDPNPRTVICDIAGNLHELGEDFVADNSEGIDSEIITKDYEHNLGLTCIYLDVTVRVERLETSLDTFATGSLSVWASTDYGLYWSQPQVLPLDGTEYFMEKKFALHMRGKAIRLKIRSSGPYEIENVIISYNVQGKSFKYDR
jgi:hypothetical protein